MKFKRHIILFASLMLLCSSLSAADARFNAPGTSCWFTAANWDPTSLPTPADNAKFEESRLCGIATTVNMGTGTETINKLEMKSCLTAGVTVQGLSPTCRATIVMCGGGGINLQSESTFRNVDWFLCKTIFFNACNNELVSLYDMSIVVVNCCEDIDIKQGRVFACNVYFYTCAECFHIGECNGSSSSTFANSTIDIASGFNLDGSGCIEFTLTAGTCMQTRAQVNCDEGFNCRFVWGDGGIVQFNIDCGAVLSADIYNDNAGNGNPYICMGNNTILELDGGTLQTLTPYGSNCGSGGRCNSAELRLNSGAIVRGDHGLIDMNILLRGGTFGDLDGPTECLYVGGEIKVDSSSNWTINASGGVMLTHTAVVDPNIDLVLNGGSFSIGEDIAIPGDTIAPNGPTVMNTLTLNNTSSLSLGVGGPSTTLTFTNGISIPGGADVLSIYGWTGPGGGAGAGTSGRLFSGVAVGDLAKIWFEGYGLGAARLGTGEIVPTNTFTLPNPYEQHGCFPPGVSIPEPSTWLSGGAVLAFTVWHGFRRRKKVYLELLAEE